MKRAKAVSFLKSSLLSPSQATGLPELKKDLNLSDSSRQSMLTPHELIQLDFDHLTACAGLGDQYSCSGVLFRGAMALQSSNPGFAPHSGSWVLMPVASLTGITVQFPSGITIASAFVMGSKPVVVTAFDANNVQIENVTIELTYSISPSATQPDAFPHHQLKVKGANMIKLVFFSAAPFVLNALFFN